MAPRSASGPLGRAPVVRLNHAVATGRLNRPEAGLAALDALGALADDPVLRDYHLLPVPVDNFPPSPGTVGPS